MFVIKVTQLIVHTDDLRSRAPNLFCSKIVRWVSNITILNIGEPNFLVNFVQHVFLQFFCRTIVLSKMANFQVSVLKKKLVSSERLRKLTYKTPLHFSWSFKQRLLSYCCFKWELKSFKMLLQIS